MSARTSRVFPTFRVGCLKLAAGALQVRTDASPTNLGTAGPTGRL